MSSIGSSHTPISAAPFESGLAKICAIGLGKQRGAQSIHSYGMRGLAEVDAAGGTLMIETTGSVLGGLAILENALDQRPPWWPGANRRRSPGGGARVAARPAG